MVGELVVVEWLFSWPGLGRLLAWTLVPSLSSSPAQQALFLDPPVLAALLTVLAALFLTADFVSALLARASDPRLGVSGEGLVDV
jgi:ABC-type dipeptide/oligopeptide/nickel transport system permease component